MAHIQQQLFIEKVKILFPEKFKNVSVLDVGSLDINGNNRKYFDLKFYIGLDITDGPNVTAVSPVHLFTSAVKYDVVISTEMLEHDIFWKESIQAMYDRVAPGGLLLITCATTGRAIHGTHTDTPQDSPATLDYYKNITKDMMLSVMENFIFWDYTIEENCDAYDLYFWGVKL